VLPHHLVTLNLIPWVCIVIQPTCFVPRSDMQPAAPAEATHRSCSLLSLLLLLYLSQCLHALTSLLTHMNVVSDLKMVKGNTQSPQSGRCQPMSSTQGEAVEHHPTCTKLHAEHSCCYSQYAVCKPCHSAG